jgi:hypothetical protein
MLPKLKNILHQAPKRDQLIKFLLLLSVFLGYFGYLSFEYDIATGGLVAALTWSFFVLCTPVADAGFLLDFPVRLITGMKMVYSEMMVWTLAFIINFSTLTYAPGAYDKSVLTHLLAKILQTPWPYWGIIALCMAGTFLSVMFGDEVMDAVSNKDRAKYNKHGFQFKVIAMVALFALIIAAYYHLIETLGIESIIQAQ